MTKYRGISPCIFYYGMYPFKIEKTFKEIKILKEFNGIVNVSCMTYTASQIK
jgi:hypothetical protein